MTLDAPLVHPAVSPDVVPRRPAAAAGDLVSALLVVLLGGTAAFARPFNHDAGWLLHVADRMLAGDRLYVDLVEVNPPLVVFLAVGAQGLARLLGVPATTALVAAVLAWAVVSLVLVQRVLRGLLPGLPARFLFLALAALALTVLPGYDFGQREHLFVVAFLPYVVLRAARLDGKGGPALPIGLLAGLGVALKPFFLLAWLAVEGVVLLRAGWKEWRRPETVAVALVLAVYALGVVLLTPAYFALARLASQVYGGFFPAPLADLVTDARMLLAVAAAGLAALLLPRRTPLAGLAALLAAAAVGSAAGVLVQGKGWDYHWLPVVAAAALSLGAAALEGLAARGPVLARFRWPLALTLVAVAGNEVAAARAVRTEMEPFYLPQMRRLVETHARDGSLFALTTRMEVTFPLVNETGVGWASRFNILWPLPGLYADRAALPPEALYRRREEMGEMERLLVDGVVEDLQRSRPALLLVDRWGPGQALGHFSYLDYFLRDARFAALMREYRPLTQVGHYVVLEHVGASPTPAGAP